jgi:murein L,D-transpeptidase YafK
MKKGGIFLIMVTILALHTSFRLPKHYAFANTANKDSYLVVVTKSDYELQLFDANSGEWLASYPVVFGSKDLGDKMMEGDRKTPEGTFHIIAKKSPHKWSRFMGIDYPNAESIEKFNLRKAQGLIPAKAKIGGEIGIHGVWPHEDYAIDQYQNWTEGCISTKNNYIQELFNLLPIGTTVTIQR